MKNQLPEIFSRLSRGRVAVIGDLMLDVYLWGSVTRISPEAPVPVFRVLRRTTCLGGASNVMRNIATLGATALAFGVTGDDECGRELRGELAKYQIDPRNVLCDDTRPTTEKKRLIASGQQLLREDCEETAPVSDELRRQLVDQVIGAIRSGSIDAVIFEDYCKGMLAGWMLEEIIAEARKHRIFTALDPKPGNLPPVKGLSVIKPNRVEAFALAGIRDQHHGEIPPEADEPLRQTAAGLLEKWAPQQLLVSLAAQGMALFSPQGKVSVIPTRAKEVFDVSGAGDTVTATFTLAMVAGAQPEEAAELANRAAGVVVGKIGTAPILAEELKAALN